MRTQHATGDTKKAEAAARLGRRVYVGRYGLVAILVFLASLGVLFQAFLPAAVSSVVILIRLLIVPIWIIFSLLTVSEIVIYFAIVVISFLCELLLGTVIDKEMFYVFASTLASLPYFKAGVVLCSRPQAKPIWYALIVALVIFNVITIFIYANALSGGDWAERAFAHTRREGEDPLFRFALGNAIEMPALVAMLTIAAAAALRRYRRPSIFIAFCLVANFASSIISQSRFVVLLAGVSIIRGWHKFHLVVRLAVILLVGGGVYLQRADLGELFSSLGRRFAGDDYNSAGGRLEIFNAMARRIDLNCIGIGNGTRSSLEMMKQAGLGYRTVEAGGLEILLEWGFLRIVLMIGFLIYAYRSTRVRFRPSLEFLLVAVQALVALPVMTFTPLFAFCSGVLCVWRASDSRENRLV